MAEKLANIFGTEEDKVNCAFYHKIGACRHGNGCSRVHNRPQYSPTIIIPHMYRNPKAAVIEMNVYGQKAALDEDKAQKDFEEFFEEVFEELKQYGPIEEMHVCDNFCEHMIGNVYVMYEDEEDSLKALNALQGRFYAGTVLQPEFSPVTDFKAATCRQFEMNQCTRGGYCNFMHLKTISPEMRRKLFGERKRPIKRSESKSGSPERSNSRSVSPSKSKSRSRSRSHRKHRSSHRSVEKRTDDKRNDDRRTDDKRSGEKRRSSRDRYRSHSRHSNDRRR